MSEVRRVQISWVGANRQNYFMTLDATEHEGHTLESEISEHPVESGINISDNIRALPDRVTLNGVISNHPIYLPRDFADGTAPISLEVKGAPVTIGNTIGRPVPIAGALLAGVALPLPGDSGVVQGWDPPFDRVAACYAALRRIRNEGTLVFIDTTLFTYADMALKSVEIARDVNTGQALVLTITAQQVQLGEVTAQEVPSIPTKKKQTGPKVAAPPSQGEPEEARSALFNLIN